MTLMSRTVLCRKIQNFINKPALWKKQKHPKIIASAGISHLVYSPGSRFHPSSNFRHTISVLIMRAVLQRVHQASVTVGDEVVSSIGRGLCVLVGIHKDDTQADMDYMVRKVLNTRLFDDTDGKRWKLSVKDSGLEILCVSQFTLYCVLKGNKPDYHQAMGGDAAKQFYHNFITQLGQQYKSNLVKDGAFGAMMQVHIQNDGPVTINLESPTTKADIP